MPGPPAPPGRAGLARLVVSVGALDRALGFYRDLLGLEVQRRAGDLAWLCTVDGVEVMLHERVSSPSDVSVAVGFLVDDVDATVRHWQGGGGVVLDPPADQPWGERMAIVRDPDGHLVCLSSAPAGVASRPSGAAGARTPR